jgi:galactose-1-phosphate uridylyltransferase
VDKASPPYATHSALAYRFLSYSHDVKKEPTSLLVSANAASYKTFWTWLLDHYPGVKKRSTLKQYWRQLKMLYKQYARQRLPENIADDVNNVSRFNSSLRDWFL